MKVRESAFGAAVFAAARLVSQNSTASGSNKKKRKPPVYDGAGDQNLAASYSCKKID
jgi:hypothetical protein